MRRLLLLLVVVAAGIPVAVAVAAAPSVTTNAASSVSTSGATLNSSVNPNGEATNVHYNYGTTALYGSTSSTVAIGNGSSAVSAPRTISGLSAGTTYHYQAVATNASAPAGITGADRTFVAGSAPAVSTSAATNIGQSTATLRGNVDPNGLATTYRFQYGTSSSSLNKSSATTSAGSGNSSIGVFANIGGLASNDRIYFRISATNSAGTKTGSTRSFVTKKSLTIGSIKIPRSRYGGSARITGDLNGSGVSNVTVTVQGTRFPFTAPLANLASARTNSKGNFAITVRGITANMRVRLVAAGIQSSVRNLYNGNRVGVKVKKTSRRLKFSGVVTPQAPNGLVRIQKRKSNGKWARMRRGTLKLYTNGRSRYSLSARRAKGVYRVQVVPRDGGAHAAGYSRKVRVR